MQLMISAIYYKAGQQYIGNDIPQYVAHDFTSRLLDSVVQSPENLPLFLEFLVVLADDVSANACLEVSNDL